MGKLFIIIIVFFNLINILIMKKILLIMVCVSMFTCITKEDKVDAIISTDTTLTEKPLDLNDSISIRQIKQMDSLHKEGKL